MCVQFGAEFAANSGYNLQASAFLRHIYAELREPPTPIHVTNAKINRPFGIYAFSSILCILKTLELTLTAFANLAGIMKKAFTPEFDVKPCMDSVFFHALMDEAYFNQVHLVFNGIGWPNGQDLGPDTIAAKLVETETAV